MVAVVKAEAVGLRDVNNFQLGDREGEECSLLAVGVTGW